MDVGYFLRDRVLFIRKFYVTASFAFVETKRKIEVGEDPFELPYSEDGEPHFYDEWIEADESLQVLGYSCLSMLSATLHLYFETWENKLGKNANNLFKSVFKKKGWFNGYRVYFLKCFEIDFTKSLTDIALLEEIVLTRNRIQHPDIIMTPRTSYLPSDMEKLPHKFFVNESELGQFTEIEESEKTWLFPPNVDITEEKLMKAIAEVEKFNIWIEGEINKHVYSS